MQFYFGEQNILRALDEAEFWKHQEAEHTTVIQLVTPNLEPAYVSKLEQFGIDFHKMHADTIRYIESVTRSRGMLSRSLRLEMLELIRKCVEQSKVFTELLGELLRNSDAVRINSASQTVINHILRESQYFIGIDTLILS